MKKIGILALSLGLLSACNHSQCDKKSATEQTQKTEQQNLIGKKAVLTYPELTAEVHYIAENQIHWKTTDPQGNTAEQTNELTYKVINEHLFFLNWIEDDGTTVSQTIDTKGNSVKAYLTFSDENGKRVSQYLEGKFELK